MFLLKIFFPKFKREQFRLKQKMQRVIRKKTEGIKQVSDVSNLHEEIYLNKLLHKISVLRVTKDIKAVKRLKFLLSVKLLSKSKVLRLCYKSVFNKFSSKPITTKKFRQNLIAYIVTINLTNTNTIISVTDIKGNVKMFYSSGQVNLKGKQKTKQPAALINILKHLIAKAKFIKQEPVALHFRNTKSHYESFIVKMLKNRFFLKTIRSYNLQPHNGCRPKKIKRFKRNFPK